MNRTPAPVADPRDAIIEHIPALRAFALSLTRNGANADDLVQDAIEKAWTRFEQFTQGTNLRAWMFTILRNTWYSERRKRSREVADSDGIMAGRLAQAPDHDARLAFDDFAAAFAQLPDEQREVLMLVGAAGFSYDEAATTCGCAVGTVKSRANRGRKRLAELMGLAEGESLDLSDRTSVAVITAQLASVR